MARTFELGDVRRGGLLAILAALLFGASTPAAKAIVAGVGPLMLAGLLYLGSGLGLTAWRLARPKSDAPKLTPGDLPWLAATVSFLASEHAGYITGAIIPVDGGFMATGALS